MRPWLALAVLAVPHAALADGPAALGTARSMRLDEAIAYARTHQPEVRAALARTRARQADADVPRAQRLPVLGATAQIFGMTANNTTGTYVSPGNFDIPRIGGTRGVSTGTFQPYAATIAAVGVNQELFDFGRIAAESAAADALVDVERVRVRKTTLDVTFDVEESYFAVLAARSVLTASTDAFERSRVHRDQAKANVASGMRSPIELTRAEADLARFAIGRLRAEGGLVAAQMTLAATIGVDDARIDAGDAPKTAPDMPALDEAIRTAGTRDPRILEAVAQLRAEEQNTRAIGAQSRPDLSLTGTFSGRAGGAPPSGNGERADALGWLPNVPNWDVGAVFTWPLFEPTVEARRDASRAREETRREEIGIVRHEEIARIRIAHATVETARTTLPGLVRSVEAARANYAQAEARFGSGLGTSVELADAEAVRTDAEIQLALGQFDVARARAEFGRAIAEGP